MMKYKIKESVTLEIFNTLTYLTKYIGAHGYKSFENTIFEVDFYYIDGGLIGAIINSETIAPYVYTFEEFYELFEPVLEVNYD